MAETELYAGDIISHVTALFAEQPGLAGMALIGSAARGLADYFSDLDFLLLWEPVPDRLHRNVILRTLPDADIPSLQFRRHEHLHIDRLRVGGRELECMHVEFHLIERLVTQVCDQASLAGYYPDRYGLWSPLAWLQQGVMLAEGDGRLRQLRAMIDPMPDELSCKLIAQSFAALKLPLLYHLHKAAMRADFFFLQDTLSDITDQLLHIVFALNGRFYPGRRWLTAELATLPLCPARLGPTLLAINTTAPQYARDVPPVVKLLVRDVAKLVQPWHPELIPAWALTAQERASA